MLFPPSHQQEGLLSCGEMGLEETSHQLLLLFCKHLSGSSNGSRAVAFPPVAFLLYLGFTGYFCFLCGPVLGIVHLGGCLIHTQISTDGLKAGEKGTQGR